MDRGGASRTAEGQGSAANGCPPDVSLACDDLGHRHDQAASALSMRSTTAVIFFMWVSPLGSDVTGVRCMKPVQDPLRLVKGFPVQSQELAPGPQRSSRFNLTRYTKGGEVVRPSTADP